MVSVFFATSNWFHLNGVVQGNEDLVNRAVLLRQPGGPSTAAAFKGYMCLGLRYVILHDFDLWILFPGGVFPSQT